MTRRWRLAALPAAAIACVVIVLAIRPGLLLEIHPPVAISVEPVPVSDEPSAALENSLRTHVETLATNIGPRSYKRPDTRDNLRKAADYITREFKTIAATAGESSAPVRSLCVPISPSANVPAEAATCDPRLPETAVFRNIELAFVGNDRASEVVVVGAHYDSDAYESSGDNPGADDNATGVAALIELARRLQGRRLSRTIRFVAFTNEEPPFFQTRWMGSYHYALSDRRTAPKAMISLETMGYYSDESGSQGVTGWQFADALLAPMFRVPQPGNYLAFVADKQSREMGLTVLRHFRPGRRLASALVVSPRRMRGIGWSDHWSFWELADDLGHDIPTVMVTDTARMRNPSYHTVDDRADRAGYIQYERIADAVVGLEGVIRTLANPQSWP